MCVVLYTRIIHRHCVGEKSKPLDNVQQKCQMFCLGKSVCDVWVTSGCSAWYESTSGGLTAVTSSCGERVVVSVERSRVISLAVGISYAVGFWWISTFGRLTTTWFCHPFVPRHITVFKWQFSLFFWVCSQCVWLTMSRSCDTCSYITNPYRLGFIFCIIILHIFCLILYNTLLPYSSSCCLPQYYTLTIPHTYTDSYHNKILL